MTTRDGASRSPPSAAQASGVPADVAVITGPTDDAKGARILRFRGDAVQAGEMRPMVEGAPLASGTELVRLKPIGPSGVPAFEVESVFKNESLPASSKSSDVAGKKKGPAQVATDEYRANWDTIFALAPKTPSKGAPS